MLFIKGTSMPLTADIFSSDWVFVVVTVPLVIFAVAISIEKRPVRNLVSKVIRYVLPVTEPNTRPPGTSWHDVLTTISSVTALATFITLAEVYFNTYFFGLDGLLLWVTNMGVIIIALILRLIVTKITGEVSGSVSLFDEYYYNIIMIYRLLAVPVLLVNFCIPYLKILNDRLLFSFVFIFAILFVIIRYIRLIRLFLRHGFYLFYLILYLCTLEFIPVLILVKYLAGTVS